MSYKETTMNPTVTSSTASQQHQQEQEMLASFAVPNPPLSTQQSGKMLDDEDNESDSSKAGSSSTNKGSIGSTGDSSLNTGPKYNNPRTLWMGDLDPWLDEPAIETLWWQILNKRVQVKVIRPKFSKSDMSLNGLSHSGYCFIEFETFDDAKQALSLNGQLLPDLAIPSQRQFLNNPDNQKKYFRLNWASGATLLAPIIQGPEYSLFVGDLSASTTEAHLLAFFQKLFPTSVKTVRVMTDPVSGKSRCFGFVRFTDELERQRALAEMNGVWFGGRPLRVALATPRNSNTNYVNSFPLPSVNSYQNQLKPNFYNDEFYNVAPIFYPPFPVLPEEVGLPVNDNSSSRMEIVTPFVPSNSDANNLTLNDNIPIVPQFVNQSYNDAENTTVFIGGLSSEVTEQTLFTLFKSFGIIQQIKIPPGKNCGFVKYSSREEAEEAIAAMQGFIIGGSRVRLGWGRVNVNSRKFHQQQAQAAQMQAAAAAMGIPLDPAGAMIAAAAGYVPLPSLSPQTVAEQIQGPPAMIVGSQYEPPNTYHESGTDDSTTPAQPTYQVNEQELSDAIKAVNLDK